MFIYVCIYRYIDSLEDRLKKMERLLENIAQSGNATATAALKNGFGPEDTDDADMAHASPEDHPTTISTSSEEPAESQSPIVVTAPAKSDQIVLPKEDESSSSCKDTGLTCINTIPDSQRVCKYIGGSAGLHLLSSNVDSQERTFGTKKMYFPNTNATKPAAGEINDGGVFVVRDQYDFEHARDIENAQLDMQGALPPKDLVDLLIKT